MTAAPPITLRPITDGDLPLLERIYASTRTEELAVVPWTDAQKSEFLNMQFRAQHAEYTSRYPDASFRIIEADGTPVGRLYVHLRTEEIRIIDISLLPEHRGHGIGSFLLECLIRESESCGKPLAIHVERQNPALHLYQRLGFTPIGETGVYLLMRRPVSANTPHP